MRLGWRGGPAPVGSYTTVRESSLSLPASELPHTVEEALFTLAGDQAVPTELSCGPSSQMACTAGQCRLRSCVALRLATPQMSALRGRQKRTF